MQACSSKEQVSRIGNCIWPSRGDAGRGLARRACAVERAKSKCSERRAKVKSACGKSGVGRAAHRRHDPLSQGARASATKGFEMISRNTLASLGIEHVVRTWLTMRCGACACNLVAVAISLSRAR